MRPLWCASSRFERCYRPPIRWAFPHHHKYHIRRRASEAIFEPLVSVFFLQAWPRHPANAMLLQRRRASENIDGAHDPETR